MFASFEYDDEDTEADVIRWEAVDKNKDSRRNYSLILKRKLSTLPTQDWESIPDVGEFECNDMFASFEYDDVIVSSENHPGTAVSSPASPHGFQSTGSFHGPAAAKSTLEAAKQHGSNMKPLNLSSKVTGIEGSLPTGTFQRTAAPSPPIPHGCSLIQPPVSSMASNQVVVA